VIFVPLNSVNSQVMALIGLEILSGVSLGAKMDLTLFSSDKEQVFFEFVEIEAHTTGESIEESFLLVLDEALVLIDDESKLDDFFSLKLVLHERPVGNSTIRGDGVEVQVLDGLINVPPHLPDRVGMLIGSYSGHVDWPVVTLDSDIVDHNSTVVKTNSEECWVKWMEIEAHNT